MTAYGEIQLAVEAIKGGRHGFIVKPWENGKLLPLSPMPFAQH